MEERKNEVPAELQEVQEHLQALKEWAEKDPAHVAFAVCGVIGKDVSPIQTLVAGTVSRIAWLLGRSAKNDKNVTDILRLAVEVLDSAEKDLILMLKCKEGIEGCEKYGNALDVLCELFKSAESTADNDDKPKKP